MLKDYAQYSVTKGGKWDLCHNLAHLSKVHVLLHCALSWFQINIVFKFVIIKQILLISSLLLLNYA